MPCHIDVDAAFVQEYQVIYVIPRHMLFPSLPLAPDIGDAPVPKRGETSFYKHIRVSGRLCGRSRRLLAALAGPVQPPVPESHQDKKCFPQRHIPGEDAVPGKPECNKEMDTEIPQLGPGAEPADCPVWGTAYGIPVKKTGMAVTENICHPSLIPSAFILLPGKPSLIPEAGCGQRPREWQ